MVIHKFIHTLWITSSKAVLSAELERRSRARTLPCLPCQRRALASNKSHFAGIFSNQPSMKRRSREEDRSGRCLDGAGGFGYTLASSLDTSKCL
jgi:hypothetical protein